MKRNHVGFSPRLMLVGYFTLAFAVSWIGALIVAAPLLLRHEPIPKALGLQMYSVMLLGPSIAGVLMTRFTEGEEGLRFLYARMRRARAGVEWYGVVLVPPVLLTVVLLSLRNFWSPAFAPNDLWVALPFAGVVGWLEEIGWSGYAFPKMSVLHGGFLASTFLGVLWAIWQLPVIGCLAVAFWPSIYWFLFFLAFTAVLVALRVLISWLYAGTNSVFLTQLMLAFSTGSLIMLSPAHVSATQQVTWCAVYAAVLWFVVAVVAAAYSSWINLRLEQRRAVRTKVQAVRQSVQDEDLAGGPRVHPLTERT